jgi:glycosyltransferase involved in cell wall biosynthesis
MKIALIHDYLLEAGGAERVLKVLTEMYPEAPIYTALAKNGTARKMLDVRRQRIMESKWAWFLKIGRFYSYFRFLLPWVWRSVDLTDYDLVITSCSGYIARGFRVREDTKVVAYCHTPPRWLYGYDTPTGAQTKWWGQAFMWVVGPFLRYFDYQSAQRVNTWIANSKEVAGRIKKFYRKEAEVVYPPVECTNATMHERNNDNEDYYLIVSRVVGGKGIEAAAKAFKKLKVKLKIVGEVIDQNLGNSVECVGRVSDEELASLYAGAAGFVALARDEDFGMTVVESMMYGTPVLAFNGGGYRETVIDLDNQNTQRVRKSDKSESQKLVQTGVLIDGLDTESIGKGIERMEKIKWNHEGIKKWASQFNRARFEREIRRIVEK